MTGTGPRGRIRKLDAEAAIAAAEAHRLARNESEPLEADSDDRRGTALPQLIASSGWTEAPHPRRRQAVARRLTESKQRAPHFYLRRRVRLDQLLAMRGQVNTFLPLRISVNDLVVKAVGAAYSRVPEANIAYTEQAMRHFDSVDVAASATRTAAKACGASSGVRLSGRVKRIKWLPDQTAMARLTAAPKPAPARPPELPSTPTTTA